VPPAFPSGSVPSHGCLARGSNAFAAETSGITPETAWRRIRPRTLASASGLNRKTVTRGRNGRTNDSAKQLAKITPVPLTRLGGGPNGWGFPIRHESRFYSALAFAPALLQIRRRHD